MEETLKMMESILTGKEETNDENQLIMQYRENLSPNILAYFYVNNFGLIERVSNKYPKLDNEDKASFCLQELDNCLHNYLPKYNTKFVTYFLTCYKRRLWAESEMMLHNNRKIIFESEVLKEDLNVFYEEEHFSINEFAKKYNLTKDEQAYCNLYNAGYTTKDIASMVKKSVQCIYKKRKNILQKIGNLV